MPDPMMTVPRGIAGVPRARDHDALQKASVALEATFLAEMLKHAGMGEAQDSFGGGIGEAQFASFLQQEQATALAEASGIGFAESLFHALVKGDRP